MAFRTAWRKHTLVWLGAVCWTGVALSAPIDMVQAFDMAFQADPQVRAARAATEAQRERTPQARAQLLPVVTLGYVRTLNDIDRTQADASGNDTTTSDRYPSQNMALTLRQPVFRKPLWDNLEQSRYLVQDAEAILQREENNLALRVVGAYLEVLLSDDQLKLMTAYRDNSRIQLEAARRSFKAGSGIRTDVDEAQAKLDMIESQYLQAEQHTQYTRRQLSVILAQPVNELARFDPNLLRLDLPEPADLEAWIRMAEQVSPEILSMEARLRAARLELAKAEGAHLPTLDVVAQLTRSSSENVVTPSSTYTNRSLALQFNMPLYAGGAVNSSIRQATAEVSRAEEQLEQARRDLGVRVHKEFRGMVEGVARIRAIEQAKVSAAQLVRSSQRAFQAGSRTVLDVISAEQQYQTVMRDLAQARYSYAMSRIALQVLSGIDVKQSISILNTALVAPEKGAPRLAVR